MTPRPDQKPKEVKRVHKKAAARLELARTVSCSNLTTAYGTLSIRSRLAFVFLCQDPVAYELRGRVEEGDESVPALPASLAFKWLLSIPFNIDLMPLTLLP